MWTFSEEETGRSSDSSSLKSVTFHVNWIKVKTFVLAMANWSFLLEGFVCTETPGMKLKQMFYLLLCLGAIMICLWLKGIPIPANYSAVKYTNTDYEACNQRSFWEGMTWATTWLQNLRKISSSAFWYSATTALAGWSGSGWMNTHTADVSLSSSLSRRSYTFTLWDFQFSCIRFQWTMRLAQRFGKTTCTQ